MFVRPREGGERRIVRRSTQALMPSGLDPSGSLVGSRGAGADGGDLVRIPLDSTEAVEVFLAAPGRQHTIRVSPDGGRAAYVTDDGERESVVLRSWPEGLAPRTIGEGGFPRWSPDGSRLYFLRGITGPVPDTLKVVEIGADGAPVGAPRALLAFDNWGYDVFPGGDLLLAMGTGSETLSTGAAATETRTVILNWLDAVRDRLGN